MEIWIYTMTSVIIISLVSLVGLVFFRKSPHEEEDLLIKKKREKLPLLFVSFAVGALFGDAFIHLLPEAFGRLGTGLSTSILIVLGILFFFSLEKFIRWRHCHVLDYEACTAHSIAKMVLIGDSVHNLIDGILIGASYTVSIPIGIGTTLAVVFHEIPQEIGDFGVLLHSGFSVKKAVKFNLLTAGFAIVGAALTLIIGPHVENFAISILPFTAGGFIYIAGSDLIPELHHETVMKSSILQFISISLGIAVMALLTFIG